MTTLRRLKTVRIAFGVTHVALRPDDRIFDAVLLDPAEHLSIGLAVSTVNGEEPTPYKERTFLVCIDGRVIESGHFAHIRSFLGPNGALWHVLEKLT